MITGKNKEQFEKWYSFDYPKLIEKRDDIILYPPVFLSIFCSKPLEEKLGVYLAFYKEVHNILIIATIDNIKDQLIRFDKIINS